MLALVRTIAKASKEVEIELYCMVFNNDTLLLFEYIFLYNFGLVQRHVRVNFSKYRVPVNTFLSNF